MEAPEKIYLQVCGDCNSNNCVDCKFEDLEENITWSKDKIFNKDVEYTRTDVFLEKACQWLSNVSIEDMSYKYNDFDTSEDWDKFIEDFRKYMKG